MAAAVERGGGGVEEGEESLDDLHEDAVTSLSRDEEEVKVKETRVCCAGCRRGLHECGGVVREVWEGFRSFDYKGKLRRSFTVEKARAKFPISIWLPKYRLGDLKGDLISGLTVALTVVPQSLAYARIAELPPQYGLYTAFMGCFVYLLLGTSRDVNLGPTAVMSLLTAEFAQVSPTYAVMLALVSGLIQIIMGVLSIGFLVDYISHPVINSFTTAAAITIACSQVKKWWGLKGIPRDFVRQAYLTLYNIPNVKIWDFLLGLICIILLYVFKRLREMKWDKSRMTTCKRVMKHSLWLLCTARNAIVVIVMAAVAAMLLEVHDLSPFSLTGNITSGIPPLRIPHCSVESLEDPANITSVSTSECLQSMGIGLVIVPLVSVIEIIAVGKAFGRKNGYNIDANQELLALGTANALGSLVSAYPVTASFSRSAVAAQSGARTTLGNLFTGSVVLLSIAFLTPLFYYIPDAALAAVIIMAVTDMINFTMIKKLWRVNKLELLPWFTTFFVSLLAGFEYGILIGIAVSLCILLYPWARPQLQFTSLTKGEGKEDLTLLQGLPKGVLVMRIPFGLLFPAIEYILEKVVHETVQDDTIRSVVLDLTHVFRVDYSVVLGIKQLMSDLKKYKCSLIIANAQAGVLEKFRLAKVEITHTSSVSEALASITANSLDKEDLNVNNVIIGYETSNGEAQVKVISEPSTNHN